MKDAIVQYRYHGRFISAGRAAQLSGLRNASKHLATSISYRVDASTASKMAKTGEWKKSARHVPRERPAPPREVPAPVEIPPPAGPTEEEEEEPGYYPERPAPEVEVERYEPSFDYEKAGFESPWTDDSLFYDDEWEVMSWDGDIADQDIETYV